jgi:hypothetical protein
MSGCLGKEDVCILNVPTKKNEVGAIQIRGSVVDIEPLRQLAKLTSRENGAEDLGWETIGLRKLGTILGLTDLLLGFPVHNQNIKPSEIAFGIGAASICPPRTYIPTEQLLSRPNQFSSLANGSDRWLFPSEIGAQLGDSHKSLVLHFSQLTSDVYVGAMQYGRSIYGRRNEKNRSGDKRESISAQPTRVSYQPIGVLEPPQPSKRGFVGRLLFALLLGALPGLAISSCGFILIQTPHGKYPDIGLTLFIAGALIGYGGAVVSAFISASADRLAEDVLVALRGTQRRSNPPSLCSLPMEIASLR